MESIGETLRASRQSKKASIADVSRATKIKPDILEKLEGDEFAKLAAPMYTKGFLKLYADYLGLDSKSLTESYLRSQGGLRREGLQMQTDAAIRARKPKELELSIRSVVTVVGALSTVIMLVLVGHHWRTHRAPKPMAVPVMSAVMPKADFDPVYVPQHRFETETLEVPGK